MRGTWGTRTRDWCYFKRPETYSIFERLDRKMVDTR
jgi:hypothetical protein